MALGLHGLDGRICLLQEGRILGRVGRVCRPTRAPGWAHSRSGRPECSRRPRRAVVACGHRARILGKGIGVLGGVPAQKLRLVGVDAQAGQQLEPLLVDMRDDAVGDRPVITPRPAPSIVSQAKVCLTQLKPAFAHQIQIAVGDLRAATRGRPARRKSGQFMVAGRKGCRQGHARGCRRLRAAGAPAPGRRRAADALLDRQELGGRPAKRLRRSRPTGSQCPSALADHGERLTRGRRVARCRRRSWDRCEC